MRYADDDDTYKNVNKHWMTSYNQEKEFLRELREWITDDVVFAYKDAKTAIGMDYWLEDFTNRSIVIDGIYEYMKITPPDSETEHIQFIQDNLM